MPEYIEIAPQNRQTIEDLAVQYYGGVAGVEMLMLDNRDRLPQGFETYLVGGTLRVRKEEPVDEKTLAEIIRLGIEPATGFREDPPPVGPDYNEDYNDDHYIE